MGEAVFSGAAGQELDPAAERRHIGVETLQLVAGVFHLTARTETRDQTRREDKTVTQTREDFTAFHNILQHFTALLSDLLQILQTLLDVTTACCVKQLVDAARVHRSNAEMSSSCDHIGTASCERRRRQRCFYDFRLIITASLLLYLQ